MRSLGSRARGAESLSRRVERPRESERESFRSFAVGKLKCKNFGCQKLFDPDDTAADACRHHTGPPPASRRAQMKRLSLSLSRASTRRVLLRRRNQKAPQKSSGSSTTATKGGRAAAPRRRRAAPADLRSLLVSRPFQVRFGQEIVPTTRTVRASPEHSPSFSPDTVSTTLKNQRNSTSPRRRWTGRTSRRSRAAPWARTRPSRPRCRPRESLRLNDEALRELEFSIHGHRDERVGTIDRPNRVLRPSHAGGRRLRRARARRRRSSSPCSSPSTAPHRRRTPPGIQIRTRSLSRSWGRGVLVAAFLFGCDGV